ncbi:MAG: hypothetical protein AAGD38_12940 [Acidobacteriota bacterium]
MKRLPRPYIRVALTVVTAALILTLAATPVIAHSFGSEYASTRYATRVDADGLWLVIVVEIPATDVLGDFRRFLRDNPEHSNEANVERFRTQQLDLIANAIDLSVDGEPVSDPWRPVDSEINGLGTEGFFVYMVEHRARPNRGGETFDVTLDNQLLTAKVVYFSSYAEARTPWRKTGDSAVPLLERGLEGEIVGPTMNDAESDLWIPDDALRQVTYTFTRQ